MPKESTQLFKALSDLNRLRILRMLQVKSLCVCEITDVLKLAASTVSQHLSILKESGFILEEKEGKWVNYKLTASPDDERIPSILSSLDFWIKDEAVIKSDLKKVKEVDRIKLCSK